MSSDTASGLLLDRRDVESHVRAMAQTQGVRFADFFGSVEDGQLVIRLVWALDAEHEYRVVRWPARGTGYPPLS